MEPDSEAIDRDELSAWIKRQARAVGFDEVGIAPIAPGMGIDHLDGWLAEGRHGEMGYMAKNRDARADPNLVLPGAKSLVIVALVYATDDDETPPPGTARISRYARGEDYHDVIRQRLKRLAIALRAKAPSVRTRAVVDSAPVMERDYARLAGLGWIGKNTLLLNKRLGSFFFLGGLLLDVDLAVDVPFETDHCGSCRRCLDACPTDAFDGPYRLDARRCISYLTIEHRSPIEESLRPQLDGWLFGCDVCQDVCPWNRKSPRTSDRAFVPVEGRHPIPLEEVLALTEESFRERFRKSPIARTGREGLVRNGAILAGNEGTREHLPALLGLMDDSEPLVREAATWAVARIESRIGPSEEVS
ncbi:Epoxyqueuosine reductase [Planctomycetes bacterium Pan216]|uniref:Epoxyqueuosine reductase n=1 Tax=Kolteria novifilia TaxID=2527975 RepID=A0A518B0Y3_9BACT|nr:Epoxyqueuosine reductase [Planctomycetes bacterium Pan216]